VLARHDEMLREAEGPAEPFDRGGRVLVAQRGDDLLRHGLFLLSVVDGPLLWASARRVLEKSPAYSVPTMTKFCWPSCKRPKPLSASPQTPTVSRRDVPYAAGSGAPPSMRKVTCPALHTQPEITPMPLWNDGSLGFSSSPALVACGSAGDEVVAVSSAAS